jgi:L-fucose isomerase-like protein
MYDNNNITGQGRKHVNLITFGSPLSTMKSILGDHKALLDRLNAVYDVAYISKEQLDKPLPCGATLVFVGSGGVEEQISAAIDKLPPYILLVADGLNNSLAASLEILSWMHIQGRHGRVLHGSIDYMMDGITDFVEAFGALTWLSGKRLGIIGKPSGWLIASGVDYASVKKSWGVQLVDLPLDEVVSGYEAISDSEVVLEVGDFMQKAIGMKEASTEDIFKAMRLYRSVKSVCVNHRLDAFTLNCFDLIPLTRTTGCLALALLNAEGIPAGCEGDIQTILTMLAVKAATGEPSFMANPSRITDNAKHEIIMAHCTIAPSMTDKYIIRSHYESLSGVAIQGILDATGMTVVKCGGKNMQRYFISDAALTECTDNPNMCRTQMHLRLHEPLDYFLQDSIGNHHVIVKGHHRGRIESLLRMLGAHSV